MYVVTFSPFIVSVQAGVTLRATQTATAHDLTGNREKPQIEDEVLTTPCIHMWA
jgi:hypothetical protein